MCENYINHQNLVRFNNPGDVMSELSDQETLSVLINEEVASYIREVGIFEDTSPTELVRQAVSMHKYIKDAQAAGFEIVLRGKNTHGYSDVYEIPGRFDVTSSED